MIGVSSENHERTFLVGSSGFAHYVVKVRNNKLKVKMVRYATLIRIMQHPTALTPHRRTSGFKKFCPWFAFGRNGRSI